MLYGEDDVEQPLLTVGLHYLKHKSGPTPRPRGRSFTATSSMVPSQARELSGKRSAPPERA